MCVETPGSPWNLIQLPHKKTCYELHFNHPWEEETWLVESWAVNQSMRVWILVLKVVHRFHLSRSFGLSELQCSHCRSKITGNWFMKILEKMPECVMYVHWTVNAQPQTQNNTPVLLVWLRWLNERERVNSVLQVKWPTMYQKREFGNVTR